MKIKCPVCREFNKDFTESELVGHLKVHSDLFLRQKYVKLLFKTHERIDIWNSMPDVDISFDMVEELKSLLE